MLLQLKSMAPSAIKRRGREVLGNLVASAELGLLHQLGAWGPGQGGLKLAAALPGLGIQVGGLNFLEATEAPSRECGRAIQLGPGGGQWAGAWIRYQPEGGSRRARQACAPAGRFAGPGAG
jgi:hypothetical protein